MGKIEPWLWDPIEGQAPPAVELHAHTSHTDGQDGVSSMVDAARALGLSAIGFAEHVNAASSYWPGFIRDIRAARKRCAGDIKILAGIEVRVIDYLGHLDLPLEPMTGVDYIVGVAHRYPHPGGGVYSFADLTWQEAARLEFLAIKALIESGGCDIIGHIGGTFQKNFAPRLFPRDLRRELLASARAKGRTVEFNARHHRDARPWLEDLRWSGVRIAAGSDAHRGDEIGRSLAVLKREWT